MDIGKDPIFRAMTTYIYKFFAIAKRRGVNAYLIDLFPLERWLQNPVPAVTNSLFIAPIADQYQIVTTKPSFYGIYYYPYELQSTDSIKDFNCLMNRMDPMRQSWLYQLIRRDLFDRGFVSFNLDTKNMSSVYGRDPMVCFDKQFENQMKIFQIEHDWIKHRLPYKNFDDTGDVAHVIMQSKFSIVLETYFSETHTITFSEKTFRCLQLPRPWLLYTHPHAVSALRHMGFDLLDDMVDHDLYDRLDNEIDRQVKILDLAQEMCDRVFDHKRLIDAARYNQNLLEKFSTTCESDYIECVQHALKKNCHALILQ